MDPNANFNDSIPEDEPDDPIPPLDVPAYSLEDDDLYACLNVSKSATTDEIIAAYRRFSRMYHPDKHLADKVKAEQIFGRIKKAYEVLSDPSQRAIYDTIGLDGLESQGNELVERYQTPQEIRDAYERLLRDKQERDMERKTNPKGSVTVNISATEFFNPYMAPDDDPYYADASVPFIEITGFHFNQSIEAPLTPRDTLTVSGSVSSQNGRGNGHIGCGLRKTLSNKTWGELELGGSTSGLDFGLKGFSQFTKRFFANFNLMCQNSNGQVGTGAVFALGNQLDTNTVGTLTCRTGSNGNSLIGGCIRDDGTTRIGLTIHLGVPHIYAMGQSSYKREGSKYQFNIKAGTFGAFIEYGIEKKVTQYSTVGALVIVGVPHGIILRIKVMRANHSYIFPIHLSEEIIPSALAYGTLIPIIGYLTVKKFFLDPYERNKAKNEKEKKQAAYRNKMAEKKAEAESAVHLMRNTYERITSEEDGKDGLVILRGLYGRLDGLEFSEISSDEVIDVTVPLQCLVKDSNLIVHKGSKFHLPGFYDPSPGDSKSLLIKYRFQNLLHEIVVKDEEEVKIPKESKNMQNMT